MARRALGRDWGHPSEDNAAAVLIGCIGLNEVGFDVDEGIVFLNDQDQVNITEVDPITFDEDMEAQNNQDQQNVTGDALTRSESILVTN